MANTAKHVESIDIGIAIFFEIGIGIGNTFVESTGLPILLLKSILNNPVSK